MFRVGRLTDKTRQWRQLYSLLPRQLLTRRSSYFT